MIQLCEHKQNRIWSFATVVPADMHFSQNIVVLMFHLINLIYFC